MIKSKITRLFVAGTAGLLISCSIENNENSDQAINELKDVQQDIIEQIVQIKELQSNQQVILEKITSLEKSVANLAIASKKRPSADNKQRPPQTDPNKVYSVEIGNSFVQGNKNAKVTIIEWGDYF